MNIGKVFNVAQLTIAKIVNGKSLCHIAIDRKVG
jgi:hypothetical protein